MVGAGLVLALLLVVGGAVIANVQESGLDPAGPPRDVAGLQSTRSADSSTVDDLRGGWVPQLQAVRVADDAADDGVSVWHSDWTGRFPALLVRGDDVGADDLDESWWLTLAAQRFGSKADVQAWCSAAALAPPDCVPRQIAD